MIFHDIDGLEVSINPRDISTAIGPLHVTPAPLSGLAPHTIDFTRIRLRDGDFIDVMETVEVIDRARERARSEL